ncbi:hypothetical protein PS391_04360 [Pediococcus acidilactici]
MDNNPEIKPLTILDIPEETRYWFVRANSQAQYYTDFLTNNYVSIDLNGVRLSDLLNISPAIRASDDALLQTYKNIFQTHDLKQFDENPSNRKKDDVTRKKDRTSELTRSSNRATRAFHFIEDFNIGDFIVVPYKSSKKFLIGVVTSDSFTKPIDHTEILDDDGQMTYDVSPFTLKRRILWIKELPRKNFPDKLSWIKTAHQSIFEFTSDANELNPYINPFYKYKENYYMRIGVNTSEKISSSTWLGYQLMVKNILGENLDDVYQKQKVQSPGDIIQYVNPQNLALLIALFHGLFGEVEIQFGDNIVKLQGVIRYFSKDERLKRKLEITNKQIKEEANKAEIANKDADTLTKLGQLPNNKSQQKSINDATSRIANSIAQRYSENSEKIERNFLEKEQRVTNMINESFDGTQAEIVKGKLKLSNENPGTLIPYESQTDNLNPSEGESGQQTLEASKQENNKNLGSETEK